MDDSDVRSPLILNEKPQERLTKQDILAALHRYFGLFLICTLTFGSYYVYDIPGALKKQLEAHFGINDFQYEAFYSVYSWPNTVIALCGGFLVDKLLGVR